MLQQARESTERLRTMFNLLKERQLNPMDLFYMRAYFGDVCESRGVYVALLKLEQLKPPYIQDQTITDEWKEIARLHSESCDLTAKICHLTRRGKT